MVMVSFTGLVILEPVEDVLVLNLSEGTEVGGDLLDLLRAWCSQPRAKQIHQHLHLFSRGIPPPALSTHSAAAHPSPLHLIPSSQFAKQLANCKLVSLPYDVLLLFSLASLFYFVLNPY